MNDIESILQGPLHERAAADQGQKNAPCAGLNVLAAEVHKNAVAHGWWDEPRSFPEIVALCHSELSEALEEYRHSRAPQETYYNECEHPSCRSCFGEDANGTPEIILDSCHCEYAKPEGIPSELADCIIRILDYCGKEGIDIERAIVEKHEYNKSRPYRHGGKKC